MSLTVLVILFICSAFAQDEGINLDPIEVRAQKKISEFTFSQPDTLKAEDLNTQSTGLVSSSLAQSSGVITSQNGGAGGRVSFFIRGTESRHVAFTIDGLKINDTSNVDRQFDAAFLSSPFLKEVLIYKSPQAVLFGSDALGGLVEMTTRKGETPGETRLNLNAGSFGTVDSSLAHDWGNERNRGTLTAYRFHTDGISRLNKKRHDATERDSSDTIQLTSSSNHHWATSVDTDLLFSYNRGNSELDGNTLDNSNDESRSDQYFIQQKTNFKINKFSAFSIRNGLNKQVRWIDNEFMGSNNESSFKGNLFQHEGLFKYDDKKLNSLVGVSREYEEMSGSGVEKSFGLHSVFTQSAYKISQFKIYGGGRAEKHSRYGSFYSGSGGVALMVYRSTLFIQYSQGFKAPSLYQLYAPSFPGFPVGNKNLVPESNHSWESGWTLTEKKVDASITLFQNRLSNLINYTSADGYFNQARFIAEGVEASFKLKQRSFHLYSSFIHQQFRKEESEVIGRPLNTIKAGISIFPTDSSEISLKARWFSSRKGSDPTTFPATIVKLNEHEVFDLGYRYIFTKVELGVQLLNILNRDYEELYGYSVMPRSIFIHLGLTF